MRNTQTPKPPQEVGTDYDKLQQEIITEVESSQSDDTEKLPKEKKYLPTFTDVNLAAKYDKYVLQPADEYWKEDSEVKKKFLQENGGNEELAYDTFMEEYLNATAEEFAEDVDTMEKAQLSIGWAGRFTDQDWLETPDYTPSVWHDNLTLSGRMRQGNTWTQSTRSMREGQIEGDAYINDKGELVQLGDDEDWENAWWNPLGGLAYNDKHVSEDGRMIVGFTYPDGDEYSRQQGALKAVYQGDRPEGEVVSRFDLGKTFLRANRREGSGALAIPRSIARSAIGTLSNAIVGGTEAMRSVVGWMEGNWGDGESTFLDATQSFTTAVKAFRMSKFDADRDKMITWSNALDLTADVVGQIALAAATGGASVAAMRGLGMVGKVAKLQQAAKAAKTAGDIASAMKYAKSARRLQRTISGISKFNTAFVYGSVAGDGIKEEALNAGFSEESASALFLLYMAAVGTIGQSSNLMPNAINANLGKRLARKAYLQHQAIEGTTNLGANKGTWELAKRLARSVNDMYGKAAEKMAMSPKLIGMSAAGIEEMFEEQAEFVVELGLKAAWNAASSIKGTRDDIKGFLTVNDPEFWEQVPAEFLLSTVAGFGGGMIGYHLPWTGPKVHEEVMPFQGEDEDKLARIAWEASRGTPRGLEAEKRFLKVANKDLKSGRVGSLKYTTSRSDKHKGFKKLTEDPKGKTIGQINYDLMMLQYNQMKISMRSSMAPTYEAFLAENSSMAKTIDNGDYLFEKYRAKQEQMNEILQVASPIAAAMESEKPKGTPWWKSKKPAEEEAPTPQEKAEKLAKEKEETGEVKPTDRPDADEGDDKKDAKTELQQAEEELRAGDKDESLRMATAMGITPIDAQRLLDLNRDVEDMATGVTTEQDFIASFIMDNPEKLQALIDEFPEIENFDGNFIRELLRGDWRRLKEDNKAFEAVKETLEASAEHVEMAADINELLNVSKIASKDGSVMLGVEAQGAWMTKFTEFVNVLVTPEELAQARIELVETHDLYGIEGSPSTRKTVRSANINLASQFNEFYATIRGKSHVERTEAIESFVDEHSAEIVRSVNTAHVAGIKSLYQLYQSEIDVGGASIIAYIKKRLPAVVHNGPEQFGSVFSPSTAKTAMDNYSGEDMVTQPLFTPDLSIYKKQEVSEAFEKWNKVQINTNIPQNPGDDIKSFLIRGFNIKDGKFVETSGDNLFTRLYTAPNSDGDQVEQPEGTTFLDKNHDLLAKLASTKRTVGDKEIFYDKKAAEDLLMQMKIRKAMLMLFTDQVANESDTPFLLQISKLRALNAKIYSKEDYYADLDEAKYREYSTFFSYYIFDPVDFVNYGMKAESDRLHGTTTLVGEEAERYQVMKERLLYMQLVLMPNLNRAIKEAEGLLKAAENVSDEMKLETEYKGGIDDYIVGSKTTRTGSWTGMATAVDMFIHKHSSKNSKDVDKGLREEDIKFLTEVYTDLVAHDPKVATDDERIRRRQLIHKMADYMWNLPAEVKHKLLTSASGKPLKVSSELYAFMLVDSKEFYNRLERVNEEMNFAPTMAQERSAFSAFIALVTQATEVEGSLGGKVKLPGFLDGYDFYKDIFLLSGVQGSGKTKMAAKLAVKIAHQYLVDNDKTGKGPTNVLLSATAGTQLNTLVKEFQGEVTVEQVGSNGNGMTLKELFALLDPEGDIDSIYKTLENVGLIVYDEATHIQADIGTSRESDLSKMLTALEKINAKRLGNSLPAIKWMAIGDQKQGSWVKGMPRAGDPEGEIDYDALTGEEMNIGRLAGGRGGARVFETFPLDYQFRAHVTEIETTSRAISKVYEDAANSGLREFFKSPTRSEIVAYWGLLNNDGDTPMYGGVDFTNSPSEDIFENQELVDHIKGQIKRDPEFSVVIVHDGLKSGKTSMPNSPLVKLAESHPDNVTIESLDNVTTESLYTVQGQEYDYVLAELPHGLLQPFANAKSASELYGYKLLSMLVGRARYFSRIHVSKYINLKSVPSDTISKLDIDTTEDLAKEWKKFREQLYPGGNTLPTTSTSTISPKRTSSPDPADPDAKSVKIFEVDKEDLGMFNGDEEAGMNDAERAALLEGIGLDPADKDHKVVQDINKLIDNLEDNDAPNEVINDLERVSRKITNGRGRNVAAEVDTEVTEDENDAIEVISGISEDVSITKTSENPMSIAIELDKAGFVFSYTHVEKEDENISPEGSNVLKRQYLFDIMGTHEDSRRGYEMLPDSQIAYHTRRAMGKSSDGEDTKNEYTFKLVTYEYKHGEEMRMKTAIVAITKDDKAFILGAFPNGKVGSGVVGDFLLERETEAATAWTHFYEGIKHLPFTEQMKAAKNYSFADYNKGKPYQAHLTQISGRKDFKPSNRNYWLLGTKLPEGDRYTPKVGSVGSVYIEFDITEAVQSGSLFKATTSGQIVTSSKEVRDNLKGLVPAEDLGNLSLGKAGEEIRVRRDQKIPEIQELTIDAFNTILRKHLIDGKDKPAPMLYTDDSGNKHMVLVVRSIKDSPIPLVYDMQKEEWNVFFGLSNGEFIMDPAHTTYEAENYYNKALEDMVATMGQMEVKIEESDMTPKTTEELAEYISKKLGYQQEVVDDEISMYKKFLKASHSTLGTKFKTLGDYSVTLNTTLKLLAKSYENVEKGGSFQTSQPLVFTKGENKGRAFMLYTYRKDHDLKSKDGLRAVMDRVSDLREKRTKQDKVEKGEYQKDNVFSILEQRDGVGVIMLDAQPMTFTEMIANIPLDSREGKLAFNQSTVSLKSKSAARLQSLLFEITHILNEKGAFGSPLAKRKYRLMENYLKTTGREKVVDTDRVQGFVDTILALKNSTKAEDQATAKLFLGILTTVVADEELGKFKVDGLDRQASKLGAVRMGVEADAKGIPLLYNSSKYAVMKYFPATKDFLDTEKREFNLANFLTLLQVNAVAASDDSKNKGAFIVPAEMSKIVHGLFDDLLLNYTKKGMLHRGIYVTPAMIAAEGSDSFWEFLKEDPDIGNKLRTTAKGLFEPSLIIPIDGLNRAIAYAATQRADIPGLEAKLGVEVDKIVDEANKTIATKDLTLEQLVDAEVRFTSDVTKIGDQFSVLSKLSLSKIMDKKLKATKDKFESAKKKFNKADFTTKDLLSDPINTGYDLTFLTTDQKNSLRDFSETLPFITTTKGLIEASDAYIKPVFDALEEGQQSVLKAYLTPIRTKLKSLRKAMSTPEYAQNLLKAVEDGDIAAGKPIVPVQMMISNSKTYGVELGNKDAVLLAYASATDIQKKSLDHLLGAVTSVPGTTEYNNNPYVSATVIIMALKNSDYKVVPTDLPSWKNLEQNYPDILADLKKRYNITDKPVDGPGKVEKIYSDFLADVNVLAASLSTETDVKVIAAHAKTLEDLIRASNLSENEQIQLIRMIDTVRAQLNPDVDVSSFFTAYIEGLPSNHKLTDSKLKSLSLMAAWVDANATADPNYSLLLRALGKEEIDPKSQEYADYVSFLDGVINGLTNAGFEGDVNIFMNTLTKIINC